MDSILYVFLPCKKVYPTGITYLADFVHRRRPDVRQRILDLSLFPRSERSPALREAVASLSLNSRVFLGATFKFFLLTKVMPH